MELDFIDEKECKRIAVDLLLAATELATICDQIKERKAPDKISIIKIAYENAAELILNVQQTANRAASELLHIADEMESFIKRNNQND